MSELHPRFATSGALKEVYNITKFQQNFMRSKSLSGKEADITLPQMFNDINYFNILCNKSSSK